MQQPTVTAPPAIDPAPAPAPAVDPESPPVPPPAPKPAGSPYSLWRYVVVRSDSGISRRWEKVADYPTEEAGRRAVRFDTSPHSLRLCRRGALSFEAELTVCCLDRPE